MVLAQIQKCKVQQDCDLGISCKHGILQCVEGFCMCDNEPPMYLASDASLRKNTQVNHCKKDSDCANKCPPICPASCFNGVCFCSGSEC